VCKIPSQPQAVADLERRIRSCRICRDTPDKLQLPHEPRPVLQVSSTARLAICGQAPGTRVHASGRPFTDPSGDRLRQWTGLDPTTFYDPAKVAIVPMGFCFPGLDARKADLPPRPECAKTWHAELFEALPQLQLVLLVGHHAQRWHLGRDCPSTLTATVAAWRQIVTRPGARRYVPLPHPSWRNSGWLKREPWFEHDLLPVLRAEISRNLAT
jgi:uracil-DNA glycosylase